MLAAMIARRGGNPALLAYAADAPSEPSETVSLVSPPSPSSQSRGTGRLVHVGDSLGVGTAPHIKADKVDVKGGRGSNEGVRKWNADTILFDLGTNDWTAKDLAQSLRRVKRLNPDARLVVPTVHGRQASKKNRLIRRLADTVVDWEAPMADSVHPTWRGYKRRAKQIKRVL